MGNLRAGRGNSDFDVRHFVNSNWLYDLPIGRDRPLARSAPKWLDHVIGGWSISGLYAWRTGFAMRTETSSFPISFVVDSPGVFVGPSSALRKNVHSDESGNIQFFADPDAARNAFRNPFPGEIGNRNNLFGPHFWNVDLGVLKNFKLPWAETHKLQFRWEMFNAFNHTTFVEPNLDINSGTFGRITAERWTPREMQFALRYDF